MRTAHINRRSIAQRARRDAEREAAPRDGPPTIPHGTVIGRIVIEYHGQRIEAEILQAGAKCRTHGIRIGDEPVQLMGLYRAAVMLTSRLARAPGRRSECWE